MKVVAIVGLAVAVALWIPPRARPRTGIVAATTTPTPGRRLSVSLLARIAVAAGGLALFPGPVGLTAAIVVLVFGGRVLARWEPAAAGADGSNWSPLFLWLSTCLRLRCALGPAHRVPCGMSRSRFRHRWPQSWWRWCIGSRSAPTLSWYGKSWRRILSWRHWAEPCFGAVGRAPRSLAR